MESGVGFRWLGVAGIEFTANGRTLALDPFFSRPPFSQFLYGRVTPNPNLSRKHLPACDYILVSHSHWDHMMDVPEVARNTGALAFGSPNTCRLLALLGVPREQIRLIKAGDSLRLGDFRVQVLPADHGFTAPMLGAGPLPPGLRPPLRIRDYKMDVCFSFVIDIAGYRLLLLPGEPVPADLLFPVPVRRGASYYVSILERVRPSVVVPVHWDNLFAPLPATAREFTRPGGMSLNWFKRLVERTAPKTTFLVPEIFKRYELSKLCQPTTLSNTVGPHESP
jgi:L-ascorbate metabolism protein UlaG (beta-lactamase superfamily)